METVDTDVKHEDEVVCMALCFIKILLINCIWLLQFFYFNMLQDALYSITVLCLSSNEACYKYGKTTQLYFQRIKEGVAIFGPTTNNGSYESTPVSQSVLYCGIDYF